MFSYGDETELDVILTLAHPPAIFRNNYIMSTALEIVKKYNIVSEESFVEVVRRVIESSEMSFARVSGRTIDSRLGMPEIQVATTW